MFVAGHLEMYDVDGGANLPDAVVTCAAQQNIGMCIWPLDCSEILIPGLASCPRVIAVLAKGL